MAVYSHSRISSFENCPLQYRYRYIDCIKKDVEGVEAFMGKLVHEVLERLYADLPRARQAKSEDFGDLFEELWCSRLTANVRVVRRNATLEGYRETGRRCVESYHRRHHPFDSSEVIGCETKVEFAIDKQGQYRMLGFIDRIDRPEPGVLEIHDYKTGGLPRNGSLRYDRQLSLYEIALRQRHPGTREVRQVWHYLAHDKTYVEHRSLDDLRHTGVDTIRSIQTIEATTSFSPRPGPLCSWCEYQDICPAFASEAPEAPGEEVETPPLPVLEPRTGQYRLFG